MKRQKNFLLNFCKISKFSNFVVLPIRLLAIGLNLIKRDLLNCHEIYLVVLNFANFYWGFNPTILNFTL